MEATDDDSFKTGATPLLTSHPTKDIKSRFKVKMSVLNADTNQEQYLIIVLDCMNGNFALKCYRSKEAVNMLFASLSIV